MISSRLLKGREEKEKVVIENEGIAGGFPLLNTLNSFKSEHTPCLCYKLTKEQTNTKCSGNLAVPRG